MIFCDTSIGLFVLSLPKYNSCCAVMSFFENMKRFYTLLKLAIGYMLLLALIIGSLYYIYGQMHSLSNASASGETFAARRNVVHNLVSIMYEAETVGQAVCMGYGNAYGNYARKLDEASLCIAVLDSLSNDSMQHLRLDTLTSLVLQKKENMRRLVVAMKNNEVENVYEKRISQLLEKNDSAVEIPKIEKKIVHREETYKVQKKKGFFRRLAEAFVPPKRDTTHIKESVEVVSVDTLSKTFNTADTLANILSGINEEVKRSREHRRSLINEQESRLRYSSIDLGQKVFQLLSDIEEEEQFLTEREAEREKQVRHDAAQAIALVASFAVVLAVVFFAIVWRDISRANMYRRKLEKAREKAENLLFAREQLMLTITHDIKAPVGSILGYLELLKTKVTDQSLVMYIDNISSSANHLLSLVKALLDYHRLESGKLDLQISSFSPYRLCESIVDCFRPSADKKGLELKFRSSCIEDVICRGDVFRIRQIVENILGNAIKFTQKGHVELFAGMSGDRLFIRITDTGCGMSEEEQKKIFQAFMRLGNAQGQEGFGLGLSITRKLVELLGGKLSLTSEIGSGSSFEVELPVEQGHADSRLVEQHQHASFPSDMHVLLVDDDAIQLELTIAMLKEVDKDCCGTNGWTVTKCMAPDDVFTALKTESYDILLTDIQMPSMNGFELLDKLHGMSDVKKMPAAIALTARSDMDEKSYCRHGFKACLSKPYSKAELENAMARALNVDAGKSKQENTVDEEPSEPHSPQSTGYLDFSGLTAFVGDDAEAVGEILGTFADETVKHLERMKDILQNSDKTALCALAHKLLPTYTLIGSSIVPLLKNLDGQRSNAVWNDEDAASVNEIIEEMERILSSLKKSVQ